jgi:hypothetical protein
MTEYKTAKDAIAAEIEKDIYHDFDGMDCNDYLDHDAKECCGWDGVNLRCDCGNHRVLWDTYKDNKGNYHAFGVAY